MAQQNFFLLVKQYFKIAGPPLAHYWQANPLFPNGFHNLPAMAQLSMILGYELNTERNSFNLSVVRKEWIFKI